MRTKTLLLTSALTALSSAALMAQTNVYSLNAVGYINVTCVPGFNMIACQLVTTNNTVNGLMPDTLNAAQTAGVLDGVTIYKYNGAGFNIASANSVTATGYPTNNWASGGNLTLNPGEAVWLKNPFTSNLVFTFVGTVPQGLLTNQISGPASFTMLSSQVPQSGDLATNLGMTNFNNGDQIFVFNPSTQQYQTYNVNFTTGNSGYQIGGFGIFTGNTGDPQLNVGQGFWYHTGSAAGGSGPITWIRNFSVNP